MKILLMVLTSHDRLGNTGRSAEFSAPYFVFRDAGFELTLASPTTRTNEKQEYL